jgi:flagella basal body P-ring formation protein FlgA
VYSLANIRRTQHGMRLALLAGMHLNAESLTLPRQRTVVSVCLAQHAGTIVRMLFAVIVALLIYSVVTTASANEVRSIQSIESIRSAAEHYIRKTASTETALAIATAGELDPRLQLAACAGELEVTTLNKTPIAARNTVGVRCRQGADWNIYLPVSVETETDVLVLREPAARLARLSATDVDIQKRRVPGLVSVYLSKPVDLQRRHLKRSLPAGTVLTIDMMNRDMVVKRGQHVTLVTTVGGIDVRAAGTALTDGGKADRIRVQNASSLKTVEGVVESANLVRVGM